MENTSYYTKGIKEEVISRISQVHTITIYCPLSDPCVNSLRETFKIMLSEYKKDDYLWYGVPAIDALNAFIFTAAFQDKMGLDVDRDIVSVIVSSLKMFIKLKFINFQFTDDKEVEESYRLLIQKKPGSVKKYTYKVELLEMNLSDYFSQSIIDMLNKIFMYNELIPNSYLDRKFVLNFKFDEYINFMNMFIGNNKENLNILDSNICDYFMSFPKLITEQKPNIRLVTNYKEI